MTEKAKECLWSRKPIPAFKETGKKALAVLLSAAIALTALPVVQMPTAAEELPGSMVQDSGYVAGKDGFHVVAYDQSARIEIPFVSGTKNYKVYLSQTPDLTDFSGASCILSSDTYQSYTYAIDGDKDAANDSKTISIVYSDSEDNTYDFYLVTNDGSADTVQESVEVKTRSTDDATWTTPGHYDTSWYGDGSASEFTIKTAAQLAGLAVLTNGLNGETATSFTGKTIHMASSVDLSAYLWTPIGISYNHFCGSFDGGNYDGGKYTVQNVVTGLHTNNSAKSDTGLFGFATSSIKNLGVVSSNVNGDQHVGGVVGYASNGTLSNSYQTGTVSGSGPYIGGVIGYAANNTVTNCYNTGSVRGRGIGGIAGHIEGSTVTNCYNTGAVSGSGYIGGVVSEADSTTMTNCYNTGAVSGSNQYVGGVVSMIYSGSSLTNCYNTGAVSGSGKYVGGVAGTATGKIITNCYNTGVVSGTGDNVGGVAGRESTLEQIINCYNTGAVSGKGNNVGGVMGDASGQTTNCYNTGAVSGTGDHIGGIAGSSSGTIRSAYSAGKVNGADTYITYNASGTADSSAASKSDLISKIDTGSDSAFIASPTEYAHYPNREDIATGVFTSSNSVNQGYPVLRSFGYTDNTDADGFSPATVTIDATNNKVTVGTDYGDGTESKPYIIRNAYQMDLVRSYTQTKDVCFKLAGNVDISPAQYNKTPDENGSWTSSDSWKAIGDQFDHFKGNLDGNHCTISGMFLSSGEVLDDAEGLFAYTVWGTIQDLGTAASNMTANGTRFTYLGSIAGFGSGTIRNCYNAGTVSSYGSTSTCELGGIVGRANYYDDSESAFISTTFENCYNSGTVIGNGNNAIVGGVVGCSDNHLAGVDYQSTLSCCYNSGAVAGSSPENSGTTGGVAGLWSGSFTDSYNVGKVSSTGYAGGVAGRVIAASDTDNIQKNCYNLGTVSNDGTVNVHGDIGGVFGCCGGSSYNSTTGLVSNCYNAGTVYNGGANPTGGVAGGIYYADVQNCYNIGKVNGISDVGGISGSVGIASLQSCYNTGVIDARSQTKGNGIGGIAGFLYGSGKIINCYNTAVIHSSSDKVGGIAGQVESAAETVPPVISTCYNTGTLDIGSGSDMYYVGGIVGNFQSGSVSLCYNIGNVHSRGGIVGNMVVYGASVSKCYYTNTYCGGGFDDSGMTPFISYKSPLDKGSTADMKEVAFADLDPEFKAAFGITAVQYPDGYESSDTNVLTVKDKTVTAVEVGDAEVRGTAGEHSNAKIIISQNALNMTDATSGFNDAGTEKVSNVVGLPVSVVVLPKFTAFSVKTGDGKNHDGTIDNLKNTVLVKVPDGTDVSNLVATFTVNADAGDVYVYADGEEPKSGVTPVDFSTDKTYSISGMSGYRAYTVVVAPESKSLAGMDDYSIKLGNNNYDGVIDEDEKTISVTVPYDTDLTKLVADFSASNGSDVTVGDTAQESGTTENDFSSPVSYDVTGLDDSTATYTVTVACADESEKSLAYLGLYDSDDNEYTGTIDQTKHTISITVPKDTDVTDLTAWFDTYAPSVKVGDDEQESGVTGNDFTDPVTYTVTAADGTEQDYTVTVTVAGTAALESYSLKEKGGSTYYDGTIDKDDHTIAVSVPKGTDVTKLIAKFTASDGTTVSVGSTKQVSETTVNNFTDPVAYTVEAADGTEQNYEVTVEVASGAEFLSYSLEDEDGNIYNGTIDRDEHTIETSVPYGTDVTELIAEFDTTPDTTVAIGDDPQESGETENDFTDPVTYTVKTEASFSQDYQVTVKIADEKSILAYSLTDGDGNTYDGSINKEKHTIAVTVPAGTDVTELTANFIAASTATITVGEDTQESGETENDFTDPVTYQVKASDDSTRDYTITVTFEDPNRFYSYSLEDEDGNTYDGTINEDTHTIAVIVSKGTNVKKLTAKFTTSSSATVEVKGTEQVSGETVNNFAKPVTYKLTSEDGSSQTYKVTVTVHSDNKDDDDKESSHHHSHSSGSSPKPKKPETKTTVDSEKNTASVSAVASNVRQNGNAAEIQVLVPTITADSSNGKTALDLSKDAAVTIELPKNDIIQQINAGKSANVSLTLPSDARSDGASNLAVSINVAKEILEAAKTSGQDMTLAVRYADDPQAAYTWTFKGDDLAKSGTPLSDVNMDVKILSTAKVPEISSVTQENQGVVVRFSQNGTLPAAATVTFSAQDQGLAANQSMDLYQYDSVSGQLIPTGKEVKVDAFGNTSLLVDNCEDYVLLPDSIRTITLDTRIYTMDIGDSYETGITLLNAPAGSYMKTYSSTDGVAATSMLPNGNVKAVGLKPGLTYVMMDLYDADHHFLTHASIRLIVKADVAKPFGNSNQQFGIY